MTSSIAPGRAESRLPPIIATLFVLGLATLLPTRYQVTPPWFPYTLAGLIVAAMLVVALVPTSVLWHRVERVTVIVLVVVAGGMNLFSVGRLVADMITHKHGYTSLTLLESAAVIWTINILVFALLYWQLDRSGPEARAAQAHGPPDFQFAEAEGTNGTSAWQPRFVDYLFLAFAASTSFSAPDYVRPVTPRAKLIVMFQAIISLVTLFLIASRAIATLS